MFLLCPMGGSLPEQGYVIMSLCVSNDHRREGIGRALIHQILRTYPEAPLYIAVRLPHATSKDHVRDHMTTRSRDLHATYQRMNFEDAWEIPNFKMLRYRR